MDYYFYEEPKQCVSSAADALYKQAASHDVAVAMIFWLYSEGAHVVW
jgi:hypothetical protein